MERERYGDEDLVEREIAQQTDSPEKAPDTDALPARERAEVVYGETDIDPRREDQPSAHRASEDEHL